MSEAWKEVRVFISSTFRDMQAERDHLVRFVFPRLREELARRRIRLVDVDLRWGVAADQDAFDLCMQEIQNCRPRFLCMLGGRFGWVPPPRALEPPFLERLRRGESPAGRLGEQELELLSWAYPDRGPADRRALRERPLTRAEVEEFNRRVDRTVALLQRAGHPEVRASITASEIAFGAIDRLNLPTFRYFYFRSPEATDSIPAPHATEFREPPSSFGADELSRLKTRIRTSSGLVQVAPDREVTAPLPVFDYPCAWDSATARITGLKAFGDRVYRDLLASVDAQFGSAEGEPLPEFEEEASAMEAFVETRTERYFVGSREEVFRGLFAHADGEGNSGILCVIGEPGSGKSALLGKFYRDYTQAAQARPAAERPLVIPHFVGASAASTNVRQLLRRLCHELKRAAGIADEIPEDYDKLREMFAAFLTQAAAKQRIVLLIDALNQLDHAHQAHAMRWLPETLPPGARAIVSVIEESGKQTAALEALRARRTPPKPVPLRALDDTDKEAIITQYLKRYRKELDSDQRRLLAGKRDADKPLYLLTALEELRTLGVYEAITERIRDMPEETQALFVWILSRLEDDDGFRDAGGEKIGATLVRRYCTYLRIGRAGMAPRELAELVSPPPERASGQSEEPQADPLGNVAALTRLLRPYLMQRGELLDYFHDQLKHAVSSVYLDEEAKRLDAHRDVAKYFRRRADPAGDASWKADFARGLAELPYHLTEGRSWDEVYGLLTDLGFLEAKCTHVAVQQTGEGTETRTVYGGVYELQEDYRRALEHFPS